MRIEALCVMVLYADLIDPPNDYRFEFSIIGGGRGNFHIYAPENTYQDGLTYEMSIGKTVPVD